MRAWLINCQITKVFAPIIERMCVWMVAAEGQEREAKLSVVIEGNCR